MYGCQISSCQDSTRSFLTKEEKIEMLEEYKKTLDQESKGVSERIAQLSKE